MGLRRLAAPVMMTSILFLVAGCQDRGGGGAVASKAPQPIEITTKSGVAMVLIPGGTFRMGSDSGTEDERPAHSVTISPFAMDKFEVTQDQYAALELPDPSHFKDPKRPVEQVRWSDAAQFCNRRSKAEGLKPCYDEATFACDFSTSGYRLPTEAEWEYAARAGADAEPASASTPAKLKSYACYAATSSGKTDLVGRKKPNAWGLHDMIGNVQEWCHDVYSPTWYQSSTASDPTGPADGKKRVLRGGGWNARADACRTTARVADFPGITDACFARDTYGFRCVRRLSADELKQLQSAPSN